MGGGAAALARLSRPLPCSIPPADVCVGSAVPTAHRHSGGCWGRGGRCARPKSCWSSLIGATRSAGRELDFSPGDLSPIGRCDGRLPATEALRSAFACNSSTYCARSLSVSRPDPSASSLSNWARKGSTSSHLMSSSLTSIPTTNSTLSTPEPSLSSEQMRSLSSCRCSKLMRAKVCARLAVSSWNLLMRAPNAPTETAMCTHDHSRAA
mmetsp:Transcript_35411/g.105012  ORF Transcript_35411/g.105012 Transcript_35411/m.105012 type:complete len:209 (-) Transcript_35411:749-1375(-)